MMVGRCVLPLLFIAAVALLAAGDGSSDAVRYPDPANVMAELQRHLKLANSLNQSVTANTTSLDNFNDLAKMFGQMASAWVSQASNFSQPDTQSILNGVGMEDLLDLGNFLGSMMQNNQSIASPDAAAIMNEVEDIWTSLNMTQALSTAILSATSRLNLNISDTCQAQLMYSVQQFSNQSWAKSMLDSWGKPEAGIMRYQMRWLGNFDECRSVTAKPDMNSAVYSTDMFAFEGKYCSVGVPGPPSPAGMPSFAQLGVCVPSGCSSGDITNLFQPLVDSARQFKQIQQFITPTSHVTATCQEKNVPLTKGAIATIAVYAFFGALCLIASIYDYILQHHTCHRPAAYEVELAEKKTTESQESIVSREFKEPSKPGAFGKFLLCFSYYTNGSKLLNTSQPKGSLECLNGLRFISMTWVILGHTLAFSLPVVKNAVTVMPLWPARFTFQAILNATVSVDSFFVLSGLLTAYLLLKNMDKSKFTVKGFLKSVPIMYLHRYIRLTPALGFMILFHTYLTLYLFDGPLKPNKTVFDDNCEQNVWINFLYLNNLVANEAQCAGWAWYLANDFQFFVITPFVVLILFIAYKFGLVLKFLMIIGSCVSAVYISVHYDLGVGMLGVRDPTANPPINPNAQTDLMSKYYFVPWTRYQSYGVGVLFGFILWKCQGNQVKIPKAINLLSWLLSAGICTAVLYGPHDVASQGHIASVAESAAYNGFSRAAWSVGVGYVILACCLGQGGWINEFLSWSGFVPLSRMTYSAYLVHPIVMTVLISSGKELRSWDTWTLTTVFIGYLTLSYAISFLFSITFEAPFMLLDKHFLTGRLGRKAKS